MGKDAFGGSRSRYGASCARSTFNALFSTANFAMLRCPVKQVLLVRNALYFSKMYQQMFLGKHALRYRLAFGFRRWMICRSALSADVVMTPTQAMLDDLAQYVKLEGRKTLVNYYGAREGEAAAPATISQPSPTSSAQTSSPGGGEWTAAGTFPSRVGSGEGVQPQTATAASKGTAVRLVYVSLYSEHKNLSTLLKALPLLNLEGERSFLLKTTVDPAWEGAAWTVTHQDDLALARRPEVAPWVRFLGPLGGKGIEHLYCEGDIFLFPSLSESFGHPLMEAMLYGLPIVASDIPVNREMCGDAAIYFNALDSEDLARQVRRVASDAALRQRLRAAAHEQVSTRFRWDAHVRNILTACSEDARTLVARGFEAAARTEGKVRVER